MPKTHFRPDTNGFAFVNSWTFEPAEVTQMNDTLHSSIDGAMGTLGNSIASIGKNFVTPVLQQFTGNADPLEYGLCGGMAFAALDYYKIGKQPPRGKDRDDQPHNTTPGGKIFREYLWRRQIESMMSNFPGMLGWMSVLHVPFLGGASLILERTKQEWITMKRHIDQGEPCPICLIGSSQNPFYNHQVLVYGYEDPDNGLGRLYLYDMNCPDRENQTDLDFRGGELEAQESCPNQHRGALRGFFCEVYADSSPPEVEW